MFIEIKVFESLPGRVEGEGWEVVMEASVVKAALISGALEATSRNMEKPGNHMYVEIRLSYKVRSNLHASLCEYDHG